MSTDQGSYRPWKVLESPGILLFRIPGPGNLKPGKRHRSSKILEYPGKSWNYKPAVLEFLVLV